MTELHENSVIAVVRHLLRSACEGLPPVAAAMLPLWYNGTAISPQPDTLKLRLQISFRNTWRSHLALKSTHVTFEFEDSAHMLQELSETITTDLLLRAYGDLRYGNHPRRHR